MFCLFLDFSGDIKRTEVYTIKVAVFDKSTGRFLIKKKIKIKDKFSEKFFSFLYRLFSDIDIEKISEIVAVKGPGRYSALRTCMSFTNCFAYLYKIPVYSITLSTDSSNTYWDEVKEKILTQKSLAKKNILLPVYK